MAKKQTPKPVAKKVTPARLKEVSDSLFMNAGSQLIAGNKLLKPKGSIMDNMNKAVGKRMIKASDKQYATSEKYNALIKKSAKKK